MKHKHTKMADHTFLYCKIIIIILLTLLYHYVVVCLATFLLDWQINKYSSQLYLTTQNLFMNTQNHKKSKQSKKRHLDTCKHTYNPLSYPNCAYGNFPIGKIGNQHRSRQKSNVSLDLRGLKHTHTHIATSCHLSTHTYCNYTYTTTPLGSLAAQSHTLTCMHACIRERTHLYTHTHTHACGSAHTTRTLTLTHTHSQA